MRQQCIFSFNLQARPQSPVNASNSSEWDSTLSDASVEMSTLISPNFITAGNVDRTSDLTASFLNGTSDIGTTSQASWLANITQETYLIVYAVSLAGMIILQLVKGFAGAKVLKAIFHVSFLKNIGRDIRKSVVSKFKAKFSCLQIKNITVILKVILKDTKRLRENTHKSEQCRYFFKTLYRNFTLQSILS